MIKIDTIIHPEREAWRELTARPLMSLEALENVCSDVFKAISEKGDKALIDYTALFDKVSLTDLQVSKEEIDKATELVSPQLKKAIQAAKDNIYRFHLAQQPQQVTVTSTKGVTCRQESRAIEKVGIYIPGGTAPLFSTVLMLATPATIAGCKEIIMCTPPGKDGNIAPAILYTASLCGVTQIFKLGGIQAIAAMTLGTESVPRVYKIFGPGNQYVMAAKQLAQRKGVAIDMPAGPSEVLVIADESAIPQFVAADLLSQAEHGADSQVILLTTTEAITKQVDTELHKLLTQISRKKLASKALANSRFIVLKSIEDCVDFSNQYAPEHLILSISNYADWTSKISNAGSVFLGNYTPESAGDYASGTNHTLPTNGYARSYSGVNLDAFSKKITFQEITQEGISELGTIIEIMAENEMLEAHALASRLRHENK